MPSHHREDSGLRYFQTSPVRGQLEPYDGDARTGWRYLQCTDTPNELKVLLPPRTAQLYAQLLLAEEFELAKGSRGASWPRVLEIRHLKDRMIRKCQRLSRSTAPVPGVTASFRILHAPPDFRLKEMERWMKNEDTGRSNRKHPVEAVRTPTRSQSPAASVCSQCGPRASQAHSNHSHTSSARSSRISQGSRTSVSQRLPTRNPASGKRRASVSSQSTFTHSHSSNERLRQPAFASAQDKFSYLSPVVEERSERSVQATPVADAPPLPNPYGETPESMAEQQQQRQQQRAEEYAEQQRAEEAAQREHVISPDPLPHPYRPPSAMQPFGSLAMPEPITMPRAEVPNFGGSELSSVPPSLPPKEDGEEAGPSGRPIPRRRSSLKQPSTRLERASKVVSWAMDNDWTDQMLKFNHIVHAAESAGDDLDEARRKFKDEIADVKDLRSNITLALERLRLQTEQLELEERALHEHEDKLTSSFERLEEKEGRYKSTVKAVLDETKRVVYAADKKREAEVLS
ncbi:hypothetical protein EWM64_g4362 [Hericium alpestre]|uniref:Uncharacterized protein n=1 Tax=Hericium alpestre TaxID=135208 RepID=A0A4Z0A005_9AGAM|nr:hypothetical protein EWM64_g4362 [Hericium alpestre]